MINPEEAIYFQLFAMLLIMVVLVGIQMDRHDDESSELFK